MSMKKIFNYDKNHNLDLQAPVEKKKSPTILNSTTDGNPCLQPDPISNSIVGSEDCLYLSVYVPEVIIIF